MKTNMLLLPALLSLPLLGMGAMLWPYRAGLMHIEPPPQKRLLVAIDTATGAARGLRLLDSEEMCVVISRAPAWPALYQLNAVERLDCRAPQ